MGLYKKRIMKKTLLADTATAAWVAPPETCLTRSLMVTKQVFHSVRELPCIGSGFQLVDIGRK